MDARDQPTGADYAWAAAQDAADSGRRNADAVKDLERRVKELEETVFYLKEYAHQHYEE